MYSNYYSILVLNLAIRVRLCGLFPLITSVVNMMYLQIIYQREALQMPRMTKQKHFSWPVNKLK